MPDRRPNPNHEEQPIFKNILSLKNLWTEGQNREGGKKEKKQKA